MKKIGKFLGFIFKVTALAISFGGIAYIIKDILDKKSSDNFDDDWDEEVDDEAKEDSAKAIEREYLNISRTAPEDAAYPDESDDSAASLKSVADIHSDLSDEDREHLAEDSLSGDTSSDYDEETE